MLPGLTGIAGFIGESPISVTYMGSLASSGSSISFGSENARRRIVGIMGHGNTGSFPGVPNCNIGGATTTRFVYDTTGDGVSEADGVAIFAANPAGTSGVCTYDWAPAGASLAIYRVIGYNTTAAHDTDLNGSTMALNIPAGGLLFAAARDCTFSSGITERNFVNSVRIGWEINMNLETNRNIVMSGFNAAAGGSADCAASFPLL